MIKALTVMVVMVIAALGLAGCTTPARPAGHPDVAPPASPARQGSSARQVPPARQVPSARQAAHTSRPGRQWVTAWAASPQAARGAGGFSHQTIRDVVFMSAGGDAVRLVLTNAYGTTALRVGQVTVAVAGAGAAIVPGSVRPVTFGGRATVAIPAGAQAVSDPVLMRVPALRDLAVSIYLPARTAAPTMHVDSQQYTWASAAGDHAAAVSAAAFPVARKSWFILSGVLVSGSRASGTVVALGDSITDGAHSTFGANARWPDDLARRLGSRPGPTLSVADEGIAGDRLLGGSPAFPGALTRFDRDVLARPGVRDIIVLIGINDIGFRAGVGARAIITGYEQLITQAHARGLKIIGATLLPFRGAGYYSAAKEATREAVNLWIRTSGAFDGVIDFATIMSDPADPLSLRPAYNSGDHLHPSDAGYRAMASAISLPMLLGG
jgi:lysophospholipase L1-like esterase